MKWIGLVMIFSGCTLFGMMMDMKYKMRIKELWAFIHAFERLKGEINYRLTPLAEGCLSVSNHANQGIGHVFRNFGIDLENRVSMDTQQLWREAIAKESHRYHLKEEDYEMLYEFGQNIGYLDKTMQETHLDLLLGKLRGSVQKAEGEQEKSSKLSTGLSMLLGACICILLI